MAAFAANHPHDPVDVIISDYMSEANMVVAASRKLAGGSGSPGAGELLVASGPAFETSFLEALEPALPDLAKHGIRVAVNAGASDTEGLYKVVREMIRKKGLSMKLKLAWVGGDAVLPAVREGMERGTSKFKNVYTGEELREWAFEPMYAQAYLGGLGIAEAFRQGAMIVICGRVSDASPVIGAAVWYHGWKREGLDRLANAFVAGHLLECSTYVTGGNFTGFKSLEKGNWVDIGFPIGEISRDGELVITKQKGSGGAVTVDTCSSQLLYEVCCPNFRMCSLLPTLSCLAACPPIIPRADFMPRWLSSLLRLTYSVDPRAMVLQLGRHSRPQRRTLPATGTRPGRTEGRQGTATTTNHESRSYSQGWFPGRDFLVPNGA